MSHGCRDWVDSTERRAASKLDRLETELNGYKTNLIKESIRMGHNDLGDFYYARGDLQVTGASPKPSLRALHTLTSVTAAPVAHESCSTDVSLCVICKMHLRSPCQVMPA